MSSLPDAWRAENLRAAAANPHYSLLIDTLGEAAEHDYIIEDPRVLGRTLVRTSMGMAAIGHAPEFFDTYGEVSHDIADGILAKQHPRLPDIVHKTELAHQMAYFGRDAFVPARIMLIRELGLPLTKLDEKLFATGALSRYSHWQKTTYADQRRHRLIRASPVSRFATGGMTPHIGSDLTEVLVESEVSEEYLFGFPRKDLMAATAGLALLMGEDYQHLVASDVEKDYLVTGDYTNINHYLRYTAERRATVLFPGDARFATRSLSLVMNFIAYMRQHALDAYGEFKDAIQAGDETALLALREREQKRTVRISNVLLTAGDPVVQVAGWTGRRRKSGLVAVGDDDGV